MGDLIKCVCVLIRQCVTCMSCRVGKARMGCQWLTVRLKRELHWTKFFYRDRDWRNLAFCPWLPYNWWQILYIFARWVVALYFLGWLIAVFAESGALDLTANTTQSANGTARGHHLPPLVFLTIWGFIVWVVYLLVAAMACTVKMVFWVWSTAHRKREPEVDPADHLQSVVVKWSEDRVAWYQKVQWVLFVLGVSLEVGIMVLYWTLLSSGDPGRNSVGNFHVHLIGGLVGLIDVVTSGIVLSLYHVYLLFVCSITYAIFSRVYYDITGNIIYPVLDYANRPVQAAVIDVVTIFLFMPLLHLLLYSISAVRRWLIYRCRPNVCAVKAAHVLSYQSFTDPECEENESKPLSDSLLRS